MEGVLKGTLSARRLYAVQHADGRMVRGAEAVQHAETPVAGTWERRAA